MIAFLLKRLYYELAWAYDAVSWLVSLGHWRAWARVALRYVKGERVLEVGCGPGHLLVALAGEGSKVTGCDLSPAMLRQAQRRVQRACLGIPLCRARVQALPFTAATFDTIVCTFPSRYIHDGATWTQFDRVLARGGRVVVVYGANLEGRSLLRWLARGLLTLGQASRQGRRLVRAGRSRLHFRHVVVEEGGDRVGLLFAERDDDADVG